MADRELEPMAAKSFTGQVKTVLEMVKIEHTLFALPFAFMGMLLAAGGWPPWRTVGWIAVAMVGARSAAMGFNRLVDRRIDAANPRTAGRALPAGLVTPAFVAGFVAASAALLVLAAWQLNPLALALSPVALAVLLLYSYTKRFTWASHLVLGLSLAGAPLGAWIAVRGAVAAPPLALAGAVLLWVAGFDVLYALQDLDFDRRAGLFSVPARFGVRAALWLSALLHAAMLALLAWLPWLYRLPGEAVGAVGGPVGLTWPAAGAAGLGAAYWVGWAGCLALISYQHAVVRPGDLSRLDAAFFQANGALSVWLFGATAVAILWP
ncbi:MAG TPA: UbiA-like polyprenyltransferase [Thermoanaerobaculia bacterium]|nr:UbiA-like polyprenyltransferase [Thermoanaerobaculia bacterium]